MTFTKVSPQSATQRPAPGPIQPAPVEQYGDRTTELQALAGNQAIRRMAEHHRRGHSVPMEMGSLLQRGSGRRALDTRTRLLMESRFGVDFTDVRINSGVDAGQAAESVQARALTVGDDIVFAPGEYTPGSAAGHKLLAHELAHVVQQRLPGGGGNTFAAERDAHDAARQIAAGGEASVSQSAATGSAQKESMRELSVSVRGRALGSVVASPDSTVVDFIYEVDGWDVAIAFGIPVSDGLSPKAWESGDGSTVYLDPATTQRVAITGLGHWKQVKLTRGRPLIDTPAPAPPKAKPKPRAKPKPKASPMPEAKPAPSTTLQETVIEAGPASEGQAPAQDPQPATAAPETAPAPTPADANELIGSHTSWGSLDEAGLGKALLDRSLSGDTASAQSVFDTLDADLFRSSDRDDVAYGFVSQASQEQLNRLAETDSGRKLLLRLYDELTAGASTEEEAKQAEKVLHARAQRIDARTIADARQNGPVIPFSGIGLSKFDSASLTAKRLPNGKIWVRSHMKREHWKYAKNLPSAAFAAGQGQEFDPDDVIGLYMVDAGPPPIYVPAMYLVMLSNAEDAKAVGMMGEAFLTGLTLGAGGGATAGTEVVEEQAAARGLGSTLLRGGKVVGRGLLKATETGLLSTLINDHRELILKHFGKTGEKFLKLWAVVDQAILIFGLANGARALGRTTIELRNSLNEWRSLQRELTLAAEETQGLNRVATGTENMLNQLDNALAAPPGAEGNLQSGASGDPYRTPAPVEPTQPSFPPPQPRTPPQPVPPQPKSPPAQTPANPAPHQPVTYPPGRRDPRPFKTGPAANDNAVPSWLDGKVANDTTLDSQAANLGVTQELHLETAVPQDVPLKRAAGDYESAVAAAGGRPTTTTTQSPPKRQGTQSSPPAPRTPARRAGNRESYRDPDMYGDRITHDSQGRLLMSTGKLEKAQVGTGSATTSAAREQAQEEGFFHAGHVRAKNLGGEGGPDVTFPQHPGLNTGQFREFERKLTQLVRAQGPTDRILYSVELKYPNPNTRVPSEITYRVRINGRTVRGVFRNNANSGLIVVY